MFGRSKENKLGKLLERAQELYFQCEYAKAEKKLNSARAIAEELGETAALAEIWNVLAGIRRTEDRYDDALELSRRALDAVESDADASEEQVGLLSDNVGQILRRLGRLREAVPYYEKTVLLLSRQEEPNHGTIACTLRALAEVHEELGRAEEAERYMRLALDRARQGKVRELDVDLANELTEQLVRTNRAAEAVSLLESLYKEYMDAFAEPQNLYAVINPEAMAFEMMKEEHTKTGSVPFCVQLLLIQLARMKHQLGQAVDVPASLPPLSDFECRMYEKAHCELAEKYAKLGVRLHVLGQETGRRDAYTAAEKHYRRSMDLMKEVDATCHPMYEVIAGHLRELYGDTGRDPRQAGA